MDMDSLGKMIENDCSRRKCTTMEYYLEFVYKESTKIPLLPMTPQPYVEVFIQLRMCKSSWIEIF